MRRPLAPPPGDCLESAQIFTRLARRLGIIPEIPENVKKAARRAVAAEEQGDASQARMAFGGELIQWAAQAPEVFKKMVFVLAETLGEEWDSATKAALWGMMMTAPEGFRENAARAGFEPGMDQGERIFTAIMDHPQGLWLGKTDETQALDGVKTPSGKLELYIPELEETARNLSPDTEARDLALPEDFPLILNAGRHTRYNANTLMRNPHWNRGKRPCTVAVHPDTARNLEGSPGDGDPVRVTTAAGAVTGELEISEAVRPGTVIIPHGFGLRYGEQVEGINVNDLTSASHRDFLGTPIHRFVPCRVEGV